MDFTLYFSFHNLCAHMHVQKTKFRRTCTLEYHLVVCIGKTKRNLRRLHVCFCFVLCFDERCKVFSCSISSLNYSFIRQARVLVLRLFFCLENITPTLELRTRSDHISKNTVKSSVPTSYGSRDSKSKLYAP